MMLMVVKHHLERIVADQVADIIPRAQSGINLCHHGGSMVMVRTEGAQRYLRQGLRLVYKGIQGEHGPHFQGNLHLNIWIIRVRQAISNADCSLLCQKRGNERIFSRASGA
jgi:hypothetical protein